MTVGRSPHRKRVPDMQGRSPQANLPEGNSILPAMGLRKRVSLRSPVRENRTPGSVRGASGNRRPYRDGAKKSVVVAQLSDKQRVGLNFIDHPMLIRDAP